MEYEYCVASVDLAEALLANGASLAERAGRLMYGEPPGPAPVLVSSRTPAPLVAAGLPDLPILHTERHILKELGLSGGGHDLDLDTLVKVPESLQNPIAVIGSRARSDSVVALLSARDLAGKPVACSIRTRTPLKPATLPDWVQPFRGTEVNFLTSVYGSDLALKNVLQDVRDGCELIVDRRRLAAVAGLRFSAGPQPETAPTGPDRPEEAPIGPDRIRAARR